MTLGYKKVRALIAKYRYKFVNGLVAIPFVTMASVSPIYAPEPSTSVDTEACTNLVFNAGGCVGGIYHLSMELFATESNNVTIAFGRDSNTNGVLDRVELDVLVGWDAGVWFYHDRRASIEERSVRSEGWRCLDLQLKLSSRKEAKTLLAVDDDGVVFCGAASASMFDPSWDMIQVKARGLNATNGIVTYEMKSLGLRVMLK